MTKEEMKEMLGRSPDYWDCLMMRMVFELEPEGLAFGMGLTRGLPKRMMSARRTRTQGRP